MFKANWERTNASHSLPEGMVEQMLRLAYPNNKLISYEFASTGCANLNIKILLDNYSDPLMLRIYIRDKDAAYREQKLAALLKPTIPLPLTHYIGELDNYCFAITEFMPGISLRELLLSNIPHDIKAILYEVGETLAKISAHEFPEPGFFDKELTIIPHRPSDDYLSFAKDCLQNDIVVSLLNPDIILQINQVISQHGHLFPNPQERQLVHGDFDPANILVNQVNGSWKVSGVLDWEFAFSGSPLWDLANMLRYAHKMPEDFQNAFLRGLKDAGIILPKHWHNTIKLLNLLSLLDCLKRSDPSNNPNRCKDIIELIESTL